MGFLLLNKYRWSIDEKGLGSSMTSDKPLNF